MATLTLQTQPTRIQLTDGNTASREEIISVWKSISENRTVRVRQLAKRMKTSTGRLHAMITFLKDLGYIAHDTPHAWDVIVSYVEIEK